MPLAFRTSLLLFMLFACSVKLKSQTVNYDSLFAEREKIILAGVDYRHWMAHWDLLKFANNKLDIGIERKMNLNLSWIGRITWNYSKISGGIYPNAGLRYYYNLEERIMKRWQTRGLKTSCFSADYFQADMTMGFNWGYKNQSDTLGGDQAYQKGIAIGPALKIGTQRPIYKHFFYDAFLGGQIIINYKLRFVGGITLGLVL